MLDSVWRYLGQLHHPPESSPTSSISQNGGSDSTDINSSQGSSSSETDTSSWDSSQGGNSSSELQPSLEIQNGEEAHLVVGETLQLTVSVENTDEEVSYTSTDEDVATVTSDGLVTGCKVGEANIEASVKGAFDSIRIIVEEDPDHEHSRPEGITLTPGINEHSYICSCGETIYENHTFDTDNRCTSCGYQIPVSEGLEYLLQDDDTYQLRSIGTFTGTELHVPYYHDGKRVTNIKFAAFQGDETIELVSLPDSIIVMGQRAFKGMTALKSVYLGAIRGLLYYSAFENCTALTEIHFSELATEIGHPLYQSSRGSRAMFAGCTALESVDIPASVTAIDRELFSGCTSLATVTGGENLKYLGEEAFLNTPFQDDTNNYEDGILYLQRVAVAAQPGLTQVNFKDGTISLGYDLFLGNTSLTQVALNEGLEFIGYSAFENCTALERIEIPESVTMIGYYVFRGDSQLIDVLYGGSFEDWLNITTYSQIPNFRLFIDGTLLTDITFPSSLTTIKKNILSGLNNEFDEIVIPSTVRKVEAGAFEGLKARSLVIEDNEDGLTIEEDGLLFSHLDSLYIGKGVSFSYMMSVSIGSSFNSDCKAYRALPKDLGSIEISPENELYEAIDNMVISKNSRALLVAFETSSGHVEIPSSVTSIGVGAFIDLETITSVKIPSSFDSIGKAAFYNCSALSSIDLGGTKVINKKAFQKTALHSVYIPSSVIAIAEYAFQGTMTDDADEGATFAVTDDWYRYKSLEKFSETGGLLATATDSNDIMAVLNGELQNKGTGFPCIARREEYASYLASKES